MTEPSPPKSSPPNVPDLTGGGEYLVPDVLEPGLTLVLVGTAPSGISARARAYYANPENKFWRTLHAVGLTPRQLAPQEYATLPRYGLGLTDVAKRHSGVDAALPGEAWRPDELRSKVEHYRPASWRLPASAALPKRWACPPANCPTARRYRRWAGRGGPNCGCCPRRVRWGTPISASNPGRRWPTGCASCAGTRRREGTYCRQWNRVRP